MAVNVKQIADRVVFQDILRPIPQHVELCRGFLNGFQKTLVFAFNVFGSRMLSHQSILEWYRGTGLRPYLAALSPEDAAALEADVLRELQQAYPIQKNGEILFRFPRFFLTATKAAASTGKEDPA